MKSVDKMYSFVCLFVCFVFFSLKVLRHHLKNNVHDLTQSLRVLLGIVPSEDVIRKINLFRGTVVNNGNSAEGTTANHPDVEGR